jgi:hypothetical protein
MRGAHCGGYSRLVQLEGEPDRLRLQEGVHPLFAELAAPARLLHVAIDEGAAVERLLVVQCVGEILYAGAQIFEYRAAARLGLFAIGLEYVAHRKLHHLRFDQVERRDQPLRRAGTGSRIAGHQRPRRLKYVQDDRARLEDLGRLFAIGRDLAEGLEMAVRLTLQIDEIDQLLVIRLSGFLKGLARADGLSRARRGGTHWKAVMVGGMRPSPLGLRSGGRGLRLVHRGDGGLDIHPHRPEAEAVRILEGARVHEA